VIRMAWLWVFALAGCQVNPGSFIGKSCNDDHPCVGGQICRDFVCSVPLSDGGTVTPTCVRWSQTANGFATPAQTCPGCGFTVGSDNAVTASAPSGTGGYAYAQVPTERLFNASEGTLRGTFQAPAGNQINGTSTFVKLGVGGGNLLELYFTDNWEIGARTSAGILQPAAVAFTPDSSFRFNAGSPHSFLFAWNRGVLWWLLVNGDVVSNVTLVGGAADPGPLTFAQFGIIDDQNTDAWSNTLSNWELCDSADGQL
jgi:hypothetical protein